MISELEAHLQLARPGIIVDVGAHAGVFTIPLAKIPDVTVLAFEPIPPVAQRLRERLNRELPDAGSNVVVYPLALGDLPRRTTLSIPTVDGGPVWEWASIAKDFEKIRQQDPEHLGQTIDFTVDVWSLDSLDLDDVRSIKLDAEGNEYAIVRGARQTIARCRPFISIELEERHATGCTWSVPAFLDALRYDGYFVHDQAVYPISALKHELMHRAYSAPSLRQYSDPYIFEFYFLPREDTQMHLKFLRLAPGGLRSEVDVSTLSGRMITR